MRRVAKCFYLAAVLVVLPLTAAEGAVPKLFQQANEAFMDKRYEAAALHAFDHLSGIKPGDIRYEPTQFLLARALEKLGLSHGAVELHFQVANNRHDPRLLPRSLAALERISRLQPFDEALVIRDLVADTDFGDLHGDLADFIFYWQGMTNLRRGLDKWASERLLKVNRRGYYFFSTLYVASIRLLHPAGRAGKEEAVRFFALLYGSPGLVAAREAMRRRSEGDSRLARTIRALINDRDTVEVRTARLPEGWQMELALLGLARVAAQTGALLPRAKTAGEEETLSKPLFYNVRIGGTSLYSRSIRHEDRAPSIKAVAARYEAVRRLRGMSLHSLARLLFEQGRYKAADRTLQAIPGGTERSSKILLERAWAMYKDGNSRRAMGLLHAMEAPVYRDLFAPDRHILRGLIYRRFCHFRAAKLSVLRFRKDHDATLLSVRNGAPLAGLSRIRAAALAQGETRKLDLFLGLLRREKAALVKVAAWRGKKLIKHLSRIYAQKIEQVQNKLGRSLELSTREMAEKLLRAEEQVNLLEYELGQAIFARVGEASESRGLAPETPADRIPTSSRRVYHRFDSEYWTGELTQYKFFIEDRCVRSR